MEENKLENIIKNKNEAVTQINEYLDSCLISDKIQLKKANLLSYWLKDYIKYINEETTFNSFYLKEYHRGDIIKVNLGFNVGNEEGGLHYCVVLDKKNAKSYSTLTVIPLSSQKEKSKIRNTSVLLGDEIYQSLLAKNKTLFSETKKSVALLNKALENLNNKIIINKDTMLTLSSKATEINTQIQEQKNRLDMYEKIDKELKQMKSGTIALVNQITTISKQRIYNPKKDFDILSDIRLSDEKMKLIDEKIKKLPQFKKIKQQK